MGVFLTATGLIKKTLAEIKAELEAQYKADFGDNIDLDDKGPFGQIIAIDSKKYADLWDLVEEIYTSRDVTQATGIALDSIVGEVGVTRLDSSPTTVKNVLLIGDEGTIVLSGNQAKQQNVDLTYTLDSDVTITKSNALKLKLEPNTSFPLSGGEVFDVTLDSVLYSYTGIASDTKKIVIDALVSSITSGVFAGTVSNEIDQFLVIDGNDSDTSGAPDVDFSALWNTNFDLELLASQGAFTADENGENTLPANTLNTIVTPVTGWNEILNPGAGTKGRNVETDDELRVRFALTFVSGNATDDAIRNAIFNNVDGVTSVTITSNRSRDTNSDGLPGKSFEVVVEGGDDDEIAQQIWNTQPSGIESHGNIEVTVKDSQGNDQAIKFSRPEAMFIYVKVQRDKYDEEVYPDNGDDLIKSSIVAWSLTEYAPGIDVINKRLNTPIYTVPGVGDTTILLDGILSPGGTPTYAEQDIPISSSQLATFDISRIIVEDKP
jgi:uncharacterized phage protein gp47/JayE